MGLEMDILSRHSLILTGTRVIGVKVASENKIAGAVLNSIL
jgi:hypothetical protein